ncbi:MAG: hypothetical protein ABL996_03105 [Micropepsaceae bacterium]
MRSRKPADWPKYMVVKRLHDDKPAYYWCIPTWARKQKCPLVSAELGFEYGAAIAAARSYNELLDAWRTRNEEPEAGAQSKLAPVGSVDWVIAKFQTSEKYKKCEPGTRTNYDGGLKLVADFRRKSGLRFGATLVTEIKPHHADTLFEKLCTGGKTGNRVTTASHAIRAMRRAWNVVARAHPIVVPEANPFRSVEIGSTGKETAYASLEQLEAFVATANELGHPSVALAALITYHWYQREKDILSRLMWSDYEAGVRVKIRHHKNRNRKKGETENIVWLSLGDPETGESLYPEIESQLEITPVRGPLMVMRDKPDPRRKKPAPNLPYNIDYFGKLCREILDAAGLPASITFASFRHGGFTESGDARATDAEMLSGGGHKTRGVLSIYAKRSNTQAVNLARKRLELRRTQREQMSE